MESMRARNRVNLVGRPVVGLFSSRRWPNRPGERTAFDMFCPNSMLSPMSDERIFDYVTLGAGLAGLAFGLEVARQGKYVAVLEQDARVGGLSRTEVFDSYRFDLGGHRFHSSWPEVTDWVVDVLDGDLLEVQRKSRIRLNGRYVDYPIQFPNALTALDLPASIRVLTSYLVAHLRRHKATPDVSFEDWVVRRFGRELYEIYFRPYTEKVWGVACTELSADWASQRIQLPSLAAAVIRSLVESGKPTPTLVSRFLYPPLGIGELPERIALKMVATGWGQLRVGCQVTSLRYDHVKAAWQVTYEQDGRLAGIWGRHVVSTIPLPHLVRMLPSDGVSADHSEDLDYRALLCVFLAIDGTRLSEDTWTYFPDRRLLVGRTHEPVNWSPHMVPQGKTSLCVEVFCTQGDDVWQRSDATLVNQVTVDLDQLGLVARGRIRDAWVQRVPYAYPIYRVGYEDAVQRVTDQLAGWPSLYWIGRTGTFRYLNMDAVLKQAIDMGRQLASGT